MNRNEAAHLIFSTGTQIVIRKDVYGQNERQVLVEVGEHRERLLSIKRGEVPFEETNQWRKELQRQFETAFEKTDLPERPDYERINDFLVRARRLAIDGGPEL